MLRRCCRSYRDLSWRPQCLRSTLRLEQASKTCVVRIFSSNSTSFGRFCVGIACMHAYCCRAYGYLYLYRYIGRIGLFDHSVVRNYLACDSAERENRWGRRRGQRWRSLRRWWRGVSHGRIASESLLDLACVGITCMRPFRRRMANPLGGDTHGA